jgi:proteasome accessory factor B
MGVADRLERLINLVIALRETRVPLRAAEIRERVAGYGQPDPDTFRRMFERDKADLRQLGVPVETAPIDRWGDQVGYRIDPRRYDLPPLALAPDELAALALAVEATGLGDVGSVALRKLEVDAGQPGIWRRAGGRPRGFEVALDEPHRDVLATAQVTRTAVRFTYRPARAEPAERTVEPHGLVHRRGVWYLVGRDRAREARRAFRLDRIEGAVREVGGPRGYPVPETPVGVDDVVPEAPAEVATAVVAASPEVAWQVARRARGAGEADGDWTVFTVPVGDPTQFCEWLREHGPEVEVRAPAELRSKLVASLQELLAQVEDIAGGGRP